MVTPVVRDRDAFRVGPRQRPIPGAQAIAARRRCYPPAKAGAGMAPATRTRRASAHGGGG